MSLTYRVAEPDDVAPLGRILSDAFAFPGDDAVPWLEKSGVENARVVRRDEGVVGGSSLGRRCRRDDQGGEESESTTCRHWMGAFPGASEDAFRSRERSWRQPCRQPCRRPPCDDRSFICPFPAARVSHQPKGFHTGRDETCAKGAGGVGASPRHVTRGTSTRTPVDKCVPRACLRRASRGRRTPSSRPHSPRARSGPWRARARRCCRSGD